jgi:hypothetical protein
VIRTAHSVREVLQQACQFFRAFNYARIKVQGQW